MPYIHQNLNPLNKNTEDCIVRAIALATGSSWDEIFWELSLVAFMEKETINSNYIWGKYLLEHGFKRYTLPDTCPICYTVKDFVKDNPKGIFVVGDGSHAIAVVDGYYVDSFDSGDRAVLFYYTKER